LGARIGRPWTDEQLVEWIESLPKKKRERYMEAYHSLKEKPFNKSDAKVKCFIKQELTKRKPGKFYKPRMIQYRTARFLVYVARWLKPIEHAFYQAKNLFCKGGKNCAKNMNSSERGRHLAGMVKTLRCPKSLSLDGTSFDAHVNCLLLDVERGFYNSCASGAGWSSEDRSKFNSAMKLQKDNRVSGVFEDGKISYVAKGRRMSGDLNTALGNCVLMSLMTEDVFSSLVGDAWRMLDDGDDCVVVVESEMWNEGMDERLRLLYRGFGMDMKIESTADARIVENIEFCQSRPVLVRGEYQMVRDYAKVMNTTRMGVRWHASVEGFKAFAGSVGLGDGIGNVGVPVIQVWAEYLRTVAEGRFTREVVADIWRFNSVDWNSSCCVVEPSDETRRSFERAFGLSPLDQVLLEETIKSFPLRFLSDQEITRFVNDQEITKQE
jgi:hypothetical protein